MLCASRRLTYLRKSPMPDGNVFCAHTASRRVFPLGPRRQATALIPSHRTALQTRSARAIDLSPVRVGLIGRHTPFSLAARVAPRMDWDLRQGFVLCPYGVRSQSARGLGAVRDGAATLNPLSPICAFNGSQGVRQGFGARTERKPRPSPVETGSSLFRYADRQSLALEGHPPPRCTRFDPVVGPRGSVTPVPG